jgi:2-phosphosulfolactate phosphatase
VSDSTTPFGQAKYQVRFDWGAAGAQRILPGAHLVVLVDALSYTTSAVVVAEQGAVPDAATARAVDAVAPGDAHAAALAASLATTGVVVLAASLRNRAAVADRILAVQERRGERTTVAIVAAGEPEPVGGGTRFTIEDQLTAGAVVDALVSLGIDHTSPEAAVASAAFEGLRRAIVHLVAASASGIALTAAGRRAEVRLATERDVTRVVPEWRDGAFRT